MVFTLSGIVLDAPDPKALARFYADLLGWVPIQDDPDDPTWIKLAPAPAGAAPDHAQVGPGLSFQQEPLYRAPTWPATAAAPQMQMHLDIQVDDLDQAQQRALALGATLADVQPQEDCRVFRDPVGHVFCLFEH